VRDYYAAHFFYQVYNRFGCAACGKQVVCNNKALPGGYCVLVDFDCGGAVFQCVFFFGNFAWQFTSLANRHKTFVKTICHWNAKNKPARFWPKNGVKL